MPTSCSIKCIREFQPKCYKSWPFQEALKISTVAEIVGKDSEINASWGNRCALIEDMEANKMQRQGLHMSMSPKRVFLDSMVSKSKNHVVRVKVVSKRSYVDNPDKQKFQRLMLVNEKGHTMRAAVFGHNVDYFDDIINEDQCYDISNVVVSSVASGYQSYPEEKQMHINSSPSIKKLNYADSSLLSGPKYTRISELSREPLPPNATFDMMVVVLSFKPPRKVKSKFSPIQSDLSELYITDDSCSEVLLLSLWSNVACVVEQFGATHPCGSVIVVTGLKTRTFNDFSLSSNNHTKLKVNPEGSRADELRKWFASNRDLVLARSNTIIKKENVATSVPCITIETAKGMKASDITQGGMVKIAAYIPDFTVKCLRVTLCCNWCGKVSDVPPESSYVCDSCHSCATSIEKLFFDFTATDGTGSLNLVAHSRIAEQLLKVTPAAVHSMGDTVYGNWVADFWQEYPLFYSSIYFISF